MVLSLLRCRCGMEHIGIHTAVHDINLISWNTVVLSGEIGDVSATRHKSVGAFDGIIFHECADAEEIDVGRRPADSLSKHRQRTMKLDRYRYPVINSAVQLKCEPFGTILRKVNDVETNGFHKLPQLAQHEPRVPQPICRWIVTAIRLSIRRSHTIDHYVVVRHRSKLPVVLRAARKHVHRMTQFG